MFEAFDCEACGVAVVRWWKPLTPLWPKRDPGPRRLASARNARGTRARSR